MLERAGGTVVVVDVDDAVDVGLDVGLDVGVDVDAGGEVIDDTVEVAAEVVAEVVVDDELGADASSSDEQEASAATRVSAAKSRSPVLAVVDWNCCAAPWKLVCTVAGKLSSAVAAWILSTASPSETPWRRL